MTDEQRKIVKMNGNGILTNAETVEALVAIGMTEAEAEIAIGIGSEPSQVRANGFKKITEGCVTQVFTASGHCISQTFTAGDQVDYEDMDGNPIPLPVSPSGDVVEKYPGFDMVQPDAPATGEPCDDRR